MSQLEFEVLVDTSLLGFCPSFDASPSENKNVLSLANDFEGGTWRYTKFQNFIWDNIAESCLSATERSYLVNHSLLTESAKKLRLTDKEDDNAKGSEIAEIVLYAIMKRHFNALPVVPKIFYKQNNQDNAKGADSVHLVLGQDTDFSIWIGEAKFYSSIADSRLAKIVASVGSLLDADKLKKENSIITNVGDLEKLIQSADVKQKVHKLLDTRSSIDDLKDKLNIPILLLHQCDATKQASQFTDAYKEELRNFHKERAMAYFKKQIEAHGNTHLYSKIKFHLILFPVPDKSKIVEKFLENVEHYKRQ